MCPAGVLAALQQQSLRSIPVLFLWWLPVALTPLNGGQYPQQRDGRGTAARLRVRHRARTERRESVEARGEGRGEIFCTRRIDLLPEQGGEVLWEEGEEARVAAVHRV